MVSDGVLAATDVADEIYATARTLVVVSGMRGIGTSLTAALLALGGAELGPTLMIEGSGRSALPRWRRNGAARVGLGALAAGTIGPESALTSVAPALDLVAANGTADGVGADALTPAARRGACRVVRSLAARYNLIVLDAGTDIALAIDACADGSGQLVLVTNNDAATIAATYAVAKVARNVGMTGAPWVIAARQALSAGSFAHAMLEDAATRFGGALPRLAGAIPDDPCLGVALGAGMCLDDAATGSPALFAAAVGVRQMLVADRNAFATDVPAVAPPDTTRDRFAPSTMAAALASAAPGR